MHENIQHLRHLDTQLLQSNQMSMKCVLNTFQYKYQKSYLFCFARLNWQKWEMVSYCVNTLLANGHEQRMVVCYRTGREEYGCYLLRPADSMVGNLITASVRSLVLCIYHWMEGDMVKSYFDHVTSLTENQSGSTTLGADEEVSKESAGRFDA